MADAIRITKTTSGKKKPKDKDLAFGNVFTDHMFVADFQEEKGWYDPRVEPYAPFALDPATAVLHYGQSLFEGLKAFRGRDGTIRLFRPQKHVERLNRTAARMTIPHLDPELILGPVVRRHLALHPPDDHRQRAVPRRAPGEGVSVLRDPFARRAVLS